MKQHTDTGIEDLTPSDPGLVPALALLATLGLSAWAAFAFLRMTKGLFF
jgi:hypothetical protein